MKQNKLNQSVLKLVTLITILLFLNLPLISALEISNVQAQDITSNSASITWKTDEPADSFTSFGKDKTSLQKIGDAALVKTHILPLENLNPNTEYVYKVESNNIIDDNKGALYAFKTPAPDTTPPALNVTAPAAITGTTLDIAGTTEPNTILTLFLNGKEISSKKAIIILKKENEPLPTTVPFTFLDVTLVSNQPNKLKIEAVDKSNNKAIWEQTITTDNKKPEITIKPLPSLITNTTITLEATISENSSVEIFLNGKSIHKTQGLSISQQLNLIEGKNTIKITAKDNAGWETSKETTITSDTKAPWLKFTIEKGMNYFEGTDFDGPGRASSNIHGTTKPSATVYLFIYTPTAYEFHPEFNEAWAKTTANEKGEFTFKDVDFTEHKINLLKLAPQQVPPGMEQYTVAALDQEAVKQYSLRYIFLQAEDAAGRRSDPRQSTASLTINKCSSANADFSINSLPRLQLPTRIDPRSLDQGRAIITAVFNITYRGTGTSSVYTSSSTTPELPYQINSVEFEKACTPGMMKDPQFKTSCTILPATTRQKIPNSDKTTWYVVYNLHGSEKLSEKKESYWNEFQKRQLMFPLKIRLNYQERDQDGKFSTPKTQVFCTDLGYSVDIPIESKEYIPDALADGTIESTAFVIRQIDTIMPYIETTYKIFGVGCVGSWLSRTALRWSRIFMSYAEVDTFKRSDDKPPCPPPPEQTKLLLKSTIDKWEETLPAEEKEALKKGYGENWEKKNTLDERCPKTASLWETEAKIDKLYKWSCDRVLCRDVPARWTASKDQKDIDNAQMLQQGCATSGGCLPLQTLENCQDEIKKEGTSKAEYVTQYVQKNPTFKCYRYDDKLCVVDTSYKSEQGIAKLILLDQIGVSATDFIKKYSGQSNLFAYLPEGGQDICVGRQDPCAQVCKNQRRSGYTADRGGNVVNDYISPGAEPRLNQKNGCYLEKIDDTGKVQLYDGKGEILKGPRYAAGYTTDCFLDLKQDPTTKELVPQKRDELSTGRLQCVCLKDEKQDLTTRGREAGKEKTKEGKGEDWDYYQDTISRETNRVSGTYYPEYRYYPGRDFSQAFGQDYLTDYLRKENAKQFPKISKSQYIGSLQSACFSTIAANLKMLKSTLLGLQNCMIQAKKTSLRDAGVCKQIFSQHVCGLLYKGIAALNSGCPSYTAADDAHSQSAEGVSELVATGFSSMQTAMQSSIQDIKDDYGNAHLNDYFSSGTQGFAQSMCMAAFGFDWPMGMDFITDAANSVSTKTFAQPIAPTRELSTYDPTTGSTIHNYEVGALIFAGCKVRRADVYLKCIGQEDQGKPGVECGKQGCDCLQATQRGPFESEKIKVLEQGQRLNLPKGQMIDLKLPSPQIISSHYRYDHVVVELTLDKYENPESCFDQEYLDRDAKNSNVARFYAPIFDASPPGLFVCQVDAPTGRYLCPEIVSLFAGAGSAYLEDPYTSCFDKISQTFISCDTPNLFLKNDQIKIKNHLFLDGGKYCLKQTVSGFDQKIGEYDPIVLPEKIQGTLAKEFNIGTVTEKIFSGTFSNIILDSNSDAGCGQPIIDVHGKALSTQSYHFTYTLQGALYSVNLPANVNPIDTSKYKIVSSQLQKTDGTSTFTPAELIQIQFDLNGVRAHGLIGQPNGPQKRCTYDVTAPIGSTQNKKAISVTTELLQPDQNGNCYNAHIPVKTNPAYGKAKHTQNIVVQLEPTSSKGLNTLHEEFMAGNCGAVFAKTQPLINRRIADMEDAQAIYYTIACHIVQGESAWNIKPEFKYPICQHLNIFFNNEYAFGDKRSSSYPTTVTNTAEYQKIAKYLSEVHAKAGCTFSIGTPPAPASSNTLCGKEPTKTGFTKPIDWNQYTCRDDTGILGCFSRDKYTDDKTKGCLGTQRCCPPKPGIGGASSDKICGDPDSNFNYEFTPTGASGKKQPANWVNYVCSSAPNIGGIIDNKPHVGGKYNMDDLNNVCWAESIYNPSPAYKCPADKLYCCPPES